ncbi:putative glycolipid-binding domain-containing protein [Chelativorans sp. YIM 93263]|uniref:putative glycolipid-binding domain-containing protein n=1 Tax=Chelativorans sp. YIM 93263 TaxID=2906648 RepID=UPI0023784A69|nr:putative glycolipid-binding domain-containing protein [Chelativorans sp. YIM 93263]
MERKWRRLDEPGLEVFQIMPEVDGFRAVATVVHAGADPFGLSYVWSLDEHWRTRQLVLRLSHPTLQEMKIERTSGGWLVDGQEAAELAACDEIDLSATPFCNSLAIRRLRGSGELTALYVDLPSLQLSCSRQRYQPLGEGRWRYIDLGVAKGFEADLSLDEDGLVVDYEGLFETINQDLQ